MSNYVSPKISIKFSNPIEEGNILTKKFYELSGKCKKLENDLKPTLQKYKLSMFENIIRQKDFKETLGIVEQLNYATDDVLGVLFEYVKSTQKDYKRESLRDAMTYINRYKSSDTKTSNLIARLDREARKRLNANTKK